MGETSPPVSKNQPTARDADPHQAMTLAPPAPDETDLDETLDRPTPPPSVSKRSDAHFRAALDAGSRTGTSLSELSRIATELSGGLSGAKQANEQLVQELGTLRAMLGTSNEQRLGLAQRLSQLERALEASEQRAERERRFLTEQQDEFLAGLLDEHEEALSKRPGEVATPQGPETAELTRKLQEAEAARALAETAREEAEAESARAREALDRAKQQRDEARVRAEKRERERDELRAEASQLRARLGTHRATSTAPPSATSHSKPPTFGGSSALTLDDGELDSNLHLPGVTPRMPSVVPRFTAPPPLERAVASEPPRSSPDSTATPFPRESTRPGVGGPKPSEFPLPHFGPPPSGWTPPPPSAELPLTPSRFQSAANLPQGLPSISPLLKQKPDPTTRPLIDYSLGEGGVQSEMLEGARLSSKPPKK